MLETVLLYIRHLLTFKNVKSARVLWILWIRVKCNNHHEWHNSTNPTVKVDGIRVCLPPREWNVKHFSRQDLPLYEVTCQNEVVQIWTSESVMAPRCTFILNILKIMFQNVFLMWFLVVLIYRKMTIYLRW